MLIEKNDSDVKELNKSQLIMLNKVFCHFSARLENTVHLFETIQGFIARFEINPKLIPAFDDNLAGRFSSRELTLFNDISKECRFFSVGVQCIQIGF